MKLKNVHYEYRGNDIWRIYFKDYAESEVFENERTDGKKPRCSASFSDYRFGIRWYVEAKLTGQFNILRRYVKDPINDYFSNDIWTNLVKKIEGSDIDYIFDEIDLRYDATIDKCYFRICCMNGTISDFFVKNMLNSQFGMAAQANGYYDTDTVGQGGLCVRRSCCGIGFGQHKDKYGQTEERIIFTVKNFCRGEADIVKVSPWTNTFIGTNKENEKEYSWVDFKQYMQKLSSSGSDIWDIEWEYDADCPFTGTEVADKLHLYLKPLAYKRLFEEEEREVKKVWISSNSSLWSVNPNLGMVRPLTPPPVPYWVNLDEDSKIGFRQKDADEVQKEIDAMTKKIYEKLEIKQVKDFDTDGAWYEYLTATEMARLGADFDGDIVEPIDLINRKEKDTGLKDVGITEQFIAVTLKAKNSTAEPIIVFNNKVMTLAEFNAFINDANNKEDNNMGTKFKYIENVKDIVECNTPTKDSKTRYYRVYFEKLSDMKNFSDRVMRCIMQDKGHMGYYYFTVKSCSPVIAKYKTLYFAWDNDERCYVIDWDTTGAMLLKASANFEIKMTAQLNDAQLAVWEAALGIGNQPKQKKEKTENLEPTKILIQGTATIVWWSDGTKTIVKCQKGDKMDPEKGIAMCVMKKFMGTNETHSNYLDFAKPAIAEYEKQQAAEKAKKKAEADKKRRAAAKKKGTAGNANYKRGAKTKAETESKEKENA